MSSNVLLSTIEQSVSNAVRTKAHALVKQKRVHKFKGYYRILPMKHHKQTLRVTSDANGYTCNCLNKDRVCSHILAVMIQEAGA